jgi:hypothetical protein
MRQGHWLYLVGIALMCASLKTPCARAADDNSAGPPMIAPLPQQPTSLGYDDSGHDRDDRHQKFKLYELQPPDISLVNALRLASHLGLSFVQPQRTEGLFSFADHSGAVRMIFSAVDGSLKYFPDLQPKPEGALGVGRNLMPVATDWLRQNSMFPAETQGLRIGEIITLSNQTGAQGTIGPVNDVLRSIHFFRMLDGLRVYGEHSILTVDVGRSGVLGFERTLLPISLDGTPVSIISKEQATEEFHRDFDPILARLRSASPNYTAQVVSTDLIYYEQGQRFVQPVYRIGIHATAPSGGVIDYYWLVPAVLNTPEPIVNMPPPLEGTSPIFAQPIKSGGTGGGSGSQSPDPIEYGVYVVRDAESGWVRDAWEFHQNIEQPIGPGGSLLVDFKQYFWDEPWMWEADPGGESNDAEDPAPDNSPFFVGNVNLALIEGHGLPWWISTESNCCDVVDLTKISGYGGLNANGEITDYVIWQSCSVIPAPGDPYGGNYNSPAGPVRRLVHYLQRLTGYL